MDISGSIDFSYWWGFSCHPLWVSWWTLRASGWPACARFGWIVVIRPIIWVEWHGVASRWIRCRFSEILWNRGQIMLWYGEILDTLVNTVDYNCNLEKWELEKIIQRKVSFGVEIMKYACYKKLIQFHHEYKLDLPRRFAWTEGQEYECSHCRYLYFTPNMMRYNGNNQVLFK